MVSSVQTQTAEQREIIMGENTSNVVVKNLSIVDDLAIHDHQLLIELFEELQNVIESIDDLATKKMLEFVEKNSYTILCTAKESYKQEQDYKLEIHSKLLHHLAIAGKHLQLAGDSIAEAAVEANDPPIRLKE
jgi:hypothetical protein